MSPEPKDTPKHKRTIAPSIDPSVAKRSVFAHVGSFFGWLGELIGEQAQIDAHKEDLVTPPFHKVREITQQTQKTSEVIKNAETICLHLDEIKQKITEEFGAAASCFIAKCIDPMIDHARYLTQALKEPSIKDDSDQNTLLSQAIESVELYSQFSDEKKLKKRIVQVAQGLIKQSIDKDLEILANYKLDAINNCNWISEEKEEKEFQLDGYLYPIIAELLGMAESKAETEDLHAFFVWKTNVDDRRNSLVELGLLTVDAMTNTTDTTQIARYDDEDEDILLEEPFNDLVKHQLENASISMTFIATLEDRVSDIFVRIDDLHFQDANSIDLVEQLLEYLKLDAERFVQISTHTKNILDSFKSLREDILKAEHLLTQKKG